MGQRQHPGGKALVCLEGVQASIPQKETLRPGLTEARICGKFFFKERTGKQDREGAGARRGSELRPKSAKA